MKNKKQKGFTLIELLVVIAIIGILAAIGLSALTSARKKARDSKRKSDMREIATAVELYYADKGTYPMSTNMANLINDLNTAGYIDRQIIDPLPTRHYCYGVSSGSGMEGLYYRVGAELEVLTDASMTTDGGVNDKIYEVGNALGTNNSGKVGNCQPGY